MSGEFKQALARNSSGEKRRWFSLGLVKCSCLLLYYVIAKRLPDSPLPGAFVGQWFRQFLARRIFSYCGPHVRVHAGVNFGTGKSIRIGENSALAADCWISNDTVIGANVMMAPRVTILSASHEFSDVTCPMIEQGAAKRRPITVGNDVWIGTQVTILPGVKVGNHSIIGASSVVTKDVPEYAIVAGNPARVLRYRNNGLH